MKIAFFKKVVFIAFLIALPFFSFCDEPSCPPEGCDEEFPGDTNTPIDSWLFILLLTGSVYGLYKVHGKESLHGKATGFYKSLIKRIAIPTSIRYTDKTNKNLLLPENDNKTSILLMPDSLRKIFERKAAGCKTRFKATMLISNSSV